MQSWEEGNIKVTITQSEESKKLDDPLMILVTRVNAANTANQDQFAYSTQLNIEESELYTHII